MKKSGTMKNTPEPHAKTGVLQVIRMFFSVIRLLHMGLGSPRILAAYLFVVFAVCSLLFTIRVPATSDFLSPTVWAKAQSRAITGFMMIVNMVVYGIIMNWKRGGAIYTAIRVAFIGSAVYLDALLVRIIYILVSDGTYF